MIDLIPIATGIVGIVIGYGTCAIMVSNNMIEAEAEKLKAIDVAKAFARTAELHKVECKETANKLDMALAENAELSDSNTRILSVNNALWQRIGNAMEQVTPGANSTVRRMARMLAGEA